MATSGSHHFTPIASWDLHEMNSHVYPNGDYIRTRFCARVRLCDVAVNCNSS
jgi:hypothetical protein